MYVFCGRQPKTLKLVGGPTWSWFHTGTNASFIAWGIFWNFGVLDRDPATKTQITKARAGFALLPGVEGFRLRR